MDLGKGWELLLNLGTFLFYISEDPLLQGSRTGVAKSISYPDAGLRPTCVLIIVIG